MPLSTDFRLKIRRFWRKNKKIIIFVIVVLILIITINRILISMKKQDSPTTTYTPHVSVLDSSSEVPKKIASSFEEFIDKYVEYCNKKDYVSAYNLISEDCKKNYFNNDYNSYVEYVKNKFDQPKRYAIQDYSNYDGKYIYNVKIFNDFLATGLTNETYMYQEEKMIASYDENKNIVFSVGNFIKSEDLQYMASNEYLKAEVTKAIYKYSFVIYTLKLTNRSDYTIVVQDNNADTTEVMINVAGEYRGLEDNMNIVLQPGETKIVNLTFSKFYDTDTVVQSLIFDAVRVMEYYTGNPDTAEEEVANAKDKFSMSISLE